MLRKGVFYPNGKERRIKIITAMISLLFLVAIAALSTTLPLDIDSSSCAVTGANPFLTGNWIEKADTTKAGALGQAVVGTGDGIYIVWCRYYNTLTSNYFREHIQSKFIIQIHHLLWNLSDHATPTHLKMVDLAVNLFKKDLSKNALQ